LAVIFLPGRAIALLGVHQGREPLQTEPRAGRGSSSKAACHRFRLVISTRYTDTSGVAKKETSSLLALIGRTIEFLVYHLLVHVVDRVSRLPRSGVQPEVERILRENLALKAQVRALVLELKSERGARPRVSLRTRAAQAFAYLLTRGDAAFQNYYLSASETTIARWRAMFRRGPWPWRPKNLGGRPPLADKIRDLIVTLKQQNPLWGARRIKEELRRMGVKVSEPTIQKVLKDAGYHPTGGHPMNLEKWKAAAKDALWALDFFFVRTAKGAWLSVLLVVDLHTRELLELRACDAWGPTAEWTIRMLASAIHRERRQPKAVVHDHGTHFLGQFERQLRVLDIERRRTPIALPFVKGYASHCTSFARFDATSGNRRRFDSLLPCFLAGGSSLGCSYRHSFLSLYA
jgi:transposase